MKNIWNWIKETLDGNKTVLGLLMSWLLEQPEVISLFGSWGLYGKLIVWLMTLYFGWKHIKKGSFSRDYK